MSDFLQALNSGRVLLMDGAMGTELERAGLPSGHCCERWNSTFPERVQAIHRAYVAAGAEVLLTNTFQANPAALAKAGLADGLETVYAKAIDNVRVAGPRFVMADIGPFDDATPEQTARLIRATKSCDALLLETWSDPDLAGSFTKVAHNRLETTLPVLVSFAFWRPKAASPLQTFKEFTPEDCALRARELNVAGLGVNCGREMSMDDIIDVVGSYRRVTDLPLFVRPNAGTPARRGDRWVYPQTASMMAARIPEILDSGVRMIGGCCGTTADHIAAFRPIVERWNDELREVQPGG